MPDNTTSNKRIAKNTIFLYIRMGLVLVVSLITTRVVLHALGVVDYGIYNVVSGFVSMFAFLNTSMANGVQRFYNYSLGRNNGYSIADVYNSALQIQCLMAIIILILLETFGMWYIYNKMVIPTERFSSALWVFHFSVVSLVVLVLQIPYVAAIIAYEKMDYYAYLSIFDVISKLCVAYAIKFTQTDKLILYGALHLLVSVILFFLYYIYAKRNFKDLKFNLTIKQDLFVSMLSFSGWNLWGNMASVAFTQGLNILLNMFFGPVVNAARGVAVQVQQAVTQFSMNFQTAINPQITKSYAIEDYDYMHSLIFRSSRFTFFLLLCICLPIFMEAEALLGIWLKEVPEYSATFLRLILCVTILDAVSNPLMVSAQATGKIKVYQSVVGGILLMIFPIAYIVLKLGGNPQSVFIVHLTICVIAFVVRLLIVRSLVRLSVGSYFKDVILRCMVVGICSLIIPIISNYLLSETLIGVLTECLISIFSAGLFSFLIGMTSRERKSIIKKIRLM